MLSASRRVGGLLSSMPPYSEVVCFVSTGLRRVGLARSDPYLSRAIAMDAVRLTPLALRGALATCSVGLVVLALPLRGRHAVPRHVHRLRRALSRTLARAPGGRPHVAVAWDRRLTLADARRESVRNDLWEIDGLDGARVRPSVQAAVALQDLLDEEMGGWPNTYASTARAPTALAPSHRTSTSNRLVGATMPARRPAMPPCC